MSDVSANKQNANVATIVIGISTCLPRNAILGGQFWPSLYLDLAHRALLGLAYQQPATSNKQVRQNKLHEIVRE